jgi:hypothetical protein
MTSRPTRSPFRLLRLPILAVALAGAQGATAAPRKAAVFDFQYAKGSPSEPTQADRERLARLGDELRSLLEKSGRYTIVSTDPVKREVEAGPDLRSCNGCADDFARKLGADAAITGEVQKVSNLILNINVYVKDLDGKGPEKAYSVDIRGDNDESFERGIRYLVKNRLLQAEP